MTASSDSRASRKGRPTVSQTATAFSMLASHLDRSTRVIVGATAGIAVLHLVCMVLIMMAMS